MSPSPAGKEMRLTGDDDDDSDHPRSRPAAPAHVDIDAPPPPTPATDADLDDKSLVDQLAALEALEDEALSDWPRPHGGGASTDSELTVMGACGLRHLYVGEVPTEWSTEFRCNEGIKVSHDNMRISYSGFDQGDPDAAAIRTNHPIPTHGCAAYYFEIEIISSGTEGFIGIGLCGKDVDLNMLPGWEADSLGYHGDNGYVFLGQGTGVPYGPRFATGDCIGCCWNMIDNTVFFTKNGLALPVAFIDVKGSYSPTVGLLSVGEIVHANFGAEPFKFDIEAFVLEQRRQLVDQIGTVSNPQPFDTMADTILDYMLHHGYAGSAAVFAKDTGRKRAIDADIDRTKTRQRICNHVLTGDIDKAMSAISEKYPSIITSNSKIVFDLRCQKFILLVKQGKANEAVLYGQQELSGYLSRGRDYSADLMEIFGLLAYKNPPTSPRSYLLDHKLRLPIARRVNAAIFAAEKSQKDSILKRVVRHTAVTLHEIAANKNGAAGLVSTGVFM